MDNCPIHIHLNTDVAIGLDLQCILPRASERGKSLQRITTYLFMSFLCSFHFTPSKEAVYQPRPLPNGNTLLFSLAFLPTLFISAHLPCPSLFCCLWNSGSCQVYLWCNTSVFKLGVKRKAEGGSEVFLSIFYQDGVLVYCYCQAEAAGEHQVQGQRPCVRRSVCAFSSECRTSFMRWKDGVRRDFNSLRTVIILRPCRDCDWYHLSSFLAAAVDCNCSWRYRCKIRHASAPGRVKNSPTLTAWYAQITHLCGWVWFALITDEVEVFATRKSS